MPAVTNMAEVRSGKTRCHGTAEKPQIRSCKAVAPTGTATVTSATALRTGSSPARELDPRFPSMDVPSYDLVMVEPKWG